MGTDQIRPMEPEQLPDDYLAIPEVLDTVRKEERKPVPTCWPAKHQSGGQKREHAVDGVTNRVTSGGFSSFNIL
jgi:hypothetical protein